jgi:large subunit ribosomal protein L18
MIEKKETRLRRARATRARIALQKTDRLTVNRTNTHIYASVISADGSKVLVSASTIEPEVRTQLASAKGRHRERGFRPRGLPIPWPGQGAGGCRA